MTRDDCTAYVSCYSIYGLNVASDVALPAAVCHDAVPDVSIRYGSVPEKLDNVIFRNRQYQITQDCILLRKKAARFLICRGKEIIIEPSSQADEARIRYRLLTTPLIALLYQRGRIVLHGSAVCVDGAAVIFMGQSGRGKSTLAAAFRRKQYPLLTDDICVLSLTPAGSLMVFPGYPQIKMHRDTARRTGIAVDSLEPLPAGLELEKYTLNVTDDFVRLPLPLHSIYELDVTSCDDTTLTPLQGHEKQFALMRNMFLPGLIRGLGRDHIYFQQFAEAVRHISLTRLIRPVSLSLLDGLVQRLECEWKTT